MSMLLKCDDERGWKYVQVSSNQLRDCPESEMDHMRRGNVYKVIGVRRELFLISSSGLLQSSDILNLEYSHKRLK